MKESSRDNEYNSEPVYYCKQCLSLAILSIPGVEDSEYCDACSNTDIGVCSIEEWEDMYVKKYGHKLIDN